MEKEREQTYNFSQWWGNIHLPFGQIPPLCPHGGRWSKTLIGT